MKINRRLRPERVVSTDDTRYQIEDPYLDVEHKVLVATNGWALVALPVEVAEGEASRYVGCRLLDMARTVTPDEEIEILGDQVGPDGPSWPTDQDRKFPAWRQVLPKKNPGDPGTVTVGLDATQLRAIALALGAGRWDDAGDDVRCQVRITCNLDDPDGPALIELGSSHPANAVACLMPCRLSGADRPSLTFVPPATRSDARGEADAVQALDAKLDELLPPRRHFCESCGEVETLPGHEECNGCEAQRRRP